MQALIFFFFVCTHFSQQGTNFEVPFSICPQKLKLFSIVCGLWLQRMQSKNNSMWKKKKSVLITLQLKLLFTLPSFYSFSWYHLSSPFPALLGPEGGDFILVVVAWDVMVSCQLPLLWGIRCACWWLLLSPSRLCTGSCLLTLLRPALSSLVCSSTFQPNSCWVLYIYLLVFLVLTVPTSVFVHLQVCISAPEYWQVGWGGTSANLVSHLLLSHVHIQLPHIQCLHWSGPSLSYWICISLLCLVMLEL